MSLERRDCLQLDEPPDVLRTSYNYTSYPRYRRTNCLLECRERRFHQVCGCIPYYYPDFGSVWKARATAT